MRDARAALRGRVLGFVFQSFQLLPALTAIENVMLTLEMEPNNANRAVALELLERVGLGMRLKHYPRQLSGGEQQRRHRASVIVTQPPVDEDDGAAEVDADRRCRRVEEAEQPDFQDNRTEN